jgi:hypothetical protein
MLFSNARVVTRKSTDRQGPSDDGRLAAPSTSVSGTLPWTSELGTWTVAALARGLRTIHAVSWNTPTATNATVRTPKTSRLVAESTSTGGSGSGVGTGGDGLVQLLRHADQVAFFILPRLQARRHRQEQQQTIRAQQDQELAQEQSRDEQVARPICGYIRPARRQHDGQGHADRIHRHRPKRRSADQQHADDPCPSLPNRQHARGGNQCKQGL